MKKITLLFTICAGSFLFSQEFLTPADRFSHSETAYLTLANGTEVQGTIDDIDRKKGLIEEITILDGAKKKKKYKPEEIKFMYLKPSNLDKLGNRMQTLSEVNNMTDSKLNQAILKKGYVYFEYVPVMIKKKRLSMMMQLVNPDFSSKMKVYTDPRAKETSKLGIGPLSVAGGIDKSYFVLKNNDSAAYKLEKSDYKDEFLPIFKSCDYVTKTYKDVAWRDFEKHVYDYTTNCN